MAGGEPGQAKSEGVFAEAEGDIREWFRRRGDGGADCGFTAMGGQGDGCAEKRGQKLVLGRQLLRSLIGDESGDGDADESVKRVPEQIKGGNFVGEEFDREQDQSDGDDGPGLQQLQAGWEREMSVTGEQSEDGDSQVKI